MEMIFCFCQECLLAFDRNYAEKAELPAYLNAYAAPKCASCGQEGKMVDTRKFEVELANIEEINGVHQFTEFSVIRYIEEG